MLVTVVIAFIVCTVPSQLIDFWDSMDKMFFKIHGGNRAIANMTNTYLVLLTYVNSCVNAYIYYPMSEYVSIRGFSILVLDLAKLGELDKFI